MVGSVEALIVRAQASRQRWMKGIGYARKLTATRAEGAWAPGRVGQASPWSVGKRKRRTSRRLYGRPNWQKMAVLGFKSVSPKMAVLGFKHEESPTGR